MRRSILLVVVMSVVFALFGAMPASALTKVRSPLALFTEPIVVEGFCPFPVTYQDISGSGTQTLVFDADGNLTDPKVRDALGAFLAGYVKFVESTLRS